MIKRKRALPIGVLVVALLAVLASIGIVSGLWSKNLVVEGTVTTGDVNVDWTAPRCGEFHPWPTGENNGEYLGKDVGDFDWTIGSADFGDQVLAISLTNTYPSYFVDCELHWVNTGSIPVNFIGFEIIPGAGLPGIGPDPEDCQILRAQNNLSLQCPQLTVNIVDGVGQVDPCGDVNGDGVIDDFDFQLCRAAHSLEIHVEQAADQSDCSALGTGDPWQISRPTLTCDPAMQVDYEFQLFLCVAQWNEEADYEQCKQSPQHEGPSPTGCGFANVVDICVDGDGIVTAGPGAFQIAVGDAVLPASAGGNPSGLDLLEPGAVDGLWQAGDDLHVEDPTGTPSCPTAARNAVYDDNANFKDCVVLDPDGSLTDGDRVTCDAGGGCGLWFRDDNGNGRYDVGEDLIVDVNGSGFFD